MVKILYILFFTCVLLLLRYGLERETDTTHRKIEGYYFVIFSVGSILGYGLFV